MKGYEEEMVKYGFMKVNIPGCDDLVIGNVKYFVGLFSKRVAKENARISSG